MRCPSVRRRAGLARAIVVLSALASSGCSLGSAPSFSGSSSPSFLEKMLALAPSDDEVEKVAAEKKKSGCGTPAQCRTALKAMVESPKRAWVGQQMPPDAYTDGTRLFAYRALRKRLKCDELSRAIDEMRGVSKSLNGPMPGITADQVARTRALNGQVESELAQERSARCRA